MAAPDEMIVENLVVPLNLTPIAIDGMVEPFGRHAPRSSVKSRCGTARDHASGKKRKVVIDYLKASDGLIWVVRSLRRVCYRAHMVLVRNNVNISGGGSRVIMFAHGFGCDQNMWATVARAFEPDFRVILFDHVGAGRSDLGAYQSEKYASLDGYADDVVEIGHALDLKDAVFVGHSVSAMIGALASLKAPGMFSDLIMVGPSPRYIDDDAYIGGFSHAQVDELVEFLGENHLGWSAAMAPAIMGNADRPELGETLTNSFCATDPEIARQFARVTFFSDNRADLPRIEARTLVLQCREDIIAPICVGEYVHAHIPNSEYVLLDATGHCPNLSAPEEVTAAIRAFV